MLINLLYWPCNGKRMTISFINQNYFKKSSPLPIYWKPTQQIREADSLFACTGCYLFEHENDNDCCLKLDASKSSINLWSDTLALAAAKRWYSSNTEVRHHFCNFLRHPTRQPVRCWKVDRKQKHNLDKALLLWNSRQPKNKNYAPSHVCNGSTLGDF